MNRERIVLGLLTVYFSFLAVLFFTMEVLYGRF